MIQRRDDLLVVVMLTLPQEAPPELGDNLQLPRSAVDSLATLSSAPARRKASAR